MRRLVKLQLQKPACKLALHMQTPHTKHHATVRIHLHRTTELLQMFRPRRDETVMWCRRCSRNKKDSKKNSIKLNQIRDLLLVTCELVFSWPQISSSRTCILRLCEGEFFFENKVITTMVIRPLDDPT